MKKLVIVFIVMMASTAYAMPGVTLGGYPACVRQEWAGDMIAFVNSGDDDSFQAYLDAEKCILMKKNIRVTVIDLPGFWGETVGFVYKGFKFWTVKGAVNYRGGIKR